MNINPTSSVAFASSMDYPREGLNRAMAKANHAASTLASGGDHFDPAIALIESSVEVKANIAVAQTVDLMHGSLLNAKG